MKNFIKYNIFAIVFAMILVMSSSSVFANAENEIEPEVDNNVIVCYDVATGTKTYYDLDELTPELRSYMDEAASGTAAMEATEDVKDVKMSKKEQNEMNEAIKNTIEEENKDKDLYDIGISTYADDSTNLVADAKLTEFPYYTTAKLYFKKVVDTNGNTMRYAGTGFALGNNLCATAAHCIFDNFGNIVTDFKAYYRYNGEKNTYSCMGKDPVKFIYYDAYISGHNSDGTIIPNNDYDIAFAVWGESIKSKTGCLGIATGLKAEDPVYTIGYPGDLSSGKRLYEANGTVSLVLDRRLSYKGFKTYGGQSGSPLYNSGYQAFGVHTHSGPSGRRIDIVLFNYLKNNGYI